MVPEQTTRETTTTETQHDEDKLKSNNDSITSTMPDIELNAFLPFLGALVCSPTDVAHNNELLATLQQAIQDQEVQLEKLRQDIAHTTTQLSSQQVQLQHHHQLQQSWSPSPQLIDVDMVYSIDDPNHLRLVETVKPEFPIPSTPTPNVKNEILPIAGDEVPPPTPSPTAVATPIEPVVVKSTEVEEARPADAIPTPSPHRRSCRVRKEKVKRDDSPMSDVSSDGDRDGGRFGSQTPVSGSMTGPSTPKAKRGQGVSCHSCKTSKENSALYFCTNRGHHAGDAKKRRCRKKYCALCLKRSYLPCLPTPTTDLTGWMCPSCLCLCLCANCMRRDKGIEGIIPHKKRGSVCSENTLLLPPGVTLPRAEYFSHHSSSGSSGTSPPSEGSGNGMTSQPISGREDDESPIASQDLIRSPNMSCSSLASAPSPSLTGQKRKHSTRSNSNPLPIDGSVDDMCVDDNDASPSPRIVCDRDSLRRTVLGMKLDSSPLFIGRSARSPSHAAAAAHNRRFTLPAPANGKMYGSPLQLARQASESSTTSTARTPNTPFQAMNLNGSPTVNGLNSRKHLDYNHNACSPGSIASHAAFSPSSLAHSSSHHELMRLTAAGRIGEENHPAEASSSPRSAGRQTPKYNTHQTRMRQTIAKLQAEQQQSSVGGSPRMAPRSSTGSPAPLSAASAAAAAGAHEQAKLRTAQSQRVEWIRHQQVLRKHQQEMYKVSQQHSKVTQQTRSSSSISFTSSSTPTNEFVTNDDGDVDADDDEVAGPPLKKHQRKSSSCSASPMGLVHPHHDTANGRSMLSNNVNTYTLDGGFFGIHPRRYSEGMMTFPPSVASVHLGQADSDDTIIVPASSTLGEVSVTGVDTVSEGIIEGPTSVTVSDNTIQEFDPILPFTPMQTNSATTAAPTESASSSTTIGPIEPQPTLMRAWTEPPVSTSEESPTMPRTHPQPQHGPLSVPLSTSIAMTPIHSRSNSIGERTITTAPPAGALFTPIPSSNAHAPAIGTTIHPAPEYPLAHGLSINPFSHTVTGNPHPNPACGPYHPSAFGWSMLPLGVGAGCGLTSPFGINFPVSSPSAFLSPYPNSSLHINFPMSGSSHGGGGGAGVVSGVTGGTVVDPPTSSASSASSAASSNGESTDSAPTCINGTPVLDGPNESQHFPA